ncbi:hypothetical protein [Microbacterium sp. T2.11-28]|uniref:hypothetical protein n=1 Tax=Microbacterium sp. T2.11-28 TaxID=3041169 RepID=UPI00247755A4|nr:hypothetical protein [Microbacterium sp. T2.11-28]CAI9389255.1 hypothetical protein MICABA_01035 [Microbacterium sp. T2.11-28]
MHVRPRSIIATTAAVLLCAGVIPAQAAAPAAGGIQPRASYALPQPTDLIDAELSNDGTTAYLATSRGGIDIVDTTTGEMSGRIAMPKVGSTALSPDGRVLVASFSSAGKARVHIISTATNKIVRTASVAKSGVLAFGPGGVGVYVAATDKVRLLNTRTGTVRDLTSFPKFAVDSPCDVLPTSDGRRLYVTDCSWMDGKPRLWAINAKTGAIGKRIDLTQGDTGNIDAGATFSRNGKALYIPAGDAVTNDRILVYRIPEATLARTIDVRGVGQPRGVVAAGDGRSLYVAGVPNDGVAKMVASSGAITDEHVLPGYPRHLRVSADRSTLSVMDVENTVVHFLDTGE